MVLVEGASLVSFFYGKLALPILVATGLAVLWVSIKNPEWGIYILFGELFFGSRGRLIEHGFLSLRLTIFVAVFLGWVIREVQSSKFKVQSYKAKFKSSEIPFSYWLLLLIIVISAIHGWFVGNGIKNVFLDANGYLYLAILPVVFSVIKTRQQLENILKILGAALVIVALKTLVIFAWFANCLPGVANVYRWVIERDIGEITGTDCTAARIFMQSQFWALMGLFIFGAAYFFEKSKWLLISAAVFSVIMSLSRSFWLGAIAGFIFAGTFLLFYYKIPFWKIFKFGLILIFIAGLELGVVYAIAKLGGGTLSASVTSRIDNPADEAAGGARLRLLPELWREIKESPVIGKGFGEEVTYKSFLPDRVRLDNPDGEITSYAFEWSYLDTWLKIGFVGLTVYLIFVWQILIKGWKALSTADAPSVNLGLLAGLVCLVVLNITTPFLNHPLGIGYLILAFVNFATNE